MVRSDGIMTVSIEWITPLMPSRSAVTTLAPNGASVTPATEYKSKSVYADVPYDVGTAKHKIPFSKSSCLKY